MTSHTPTIPMTVSANESSCWLDTTPFARYAAGAGGWFAIATVAATAPFWRVVCNGCAAVELVKAGLIEGTLGIDLGKGAGGAGCADTIRAGMLS